MADFDVTASVSGMKELEQTLAVAAKREVKNAIRRMAKEAAEIWIKAIRENAPRLSGFLAEHINIETHYRDGGARLEVYVGPDPAAFYALFQEFGTRFQEAHPFVRPAFDEHQDDVLQVFAETLKLSLTQLESQANV